jgi:hypothetical protein
VIGEAIESSWDIGRADTIIALVVRRVRRVVRRVRRMVGVFIMGWRFEVQVRGFGRRCGWRCVSNWMGWFLGLRGRSWWGVYICLGFMKEEFNGI